MFSGLPFCPVNNNALLTSMLPCKQCSIAFESILPWRQINGYQYYPAIPFFMLGIGVTFDEQHGPSQFEPISAIGQINNEGRHQEQHPSSIGSRGWLMRSSWVGVLSQQEENIHPTNHWVLPSGTTPKSKVVQGLVLWLYYECCLYLKENICIQQIIWIYYGTQHPSWIGPRAGSWVKYVLS